MWPASIGQPHNYYTYLYGIYKYLYNYYALLYLQLLLYARTRMDMSRIDMM